MTILELREKRAKAWDAAKAFLDSHRTDKGILSAEDDAAYSRMEQDISDLSKEIARMEERGVFIAHCPQSNTNLCSGASPVRQLLEEAGYQVGEVVIVPDEQPLIEEALINAAGEDIALIVTTGGTGFAPRDVTPEATLAVCQRLTPGIPEAMRAASMAITPRGCLSRAAAGIRNRSLIINLPGSPKAARENLEAVLDPIGHGLQMLRGGQADCAALL